MNNSKLATETNKKIGEKCLAILKQYKTNGIIINIIQLHPLKIFRVVIKDVTKISFSLNEV